MVVFGLPVRDESCRLSSPPVMMLNGRPEPISSSGAQVRPLKTLLTKALPCTLPV